MIHPSHQPEARTAIRITLLLLALLVLVASLPTSKFALSPALYLPLHTALETLSLTVSGLIFGLVWSARHEQLPSSITLLGSLFLGVGLLDFSHMLSVQGMPDFITPASPEKGIYFWLLARLLGSLALLAAVLMRWNKSRQKKLFLILTLWVLVLVVLAHGLWFLYPDIHPRTFIEGQGLTTFKINFEYALIALNLISAAIVLHHLRQPREYGSGNMLAAICIMAQSEFFFTLYADVTDVYNLLGHFYKVIAYVFLYRAIFVGTVQQPYALLRYSQQQLLTTLQTLPDLVFEVDLAGRYLHIHTPRGAGLALPTKQLLGRTIYEVLPEQACTTIDAALHEALEQGYSRGKIIKLTSEGGDKWSELSVARKASDNSASPHFLIISRDISERVENEQALRMLSLAVSQSPISILITDPKGRILFVNPAFTHISGYSRADVIGRNPRMLRSGKTSKSTYQAMWAQLTQGEPWHGELVNRNKAGQEYTQSAIIYPVRNAEGEITNYLAHQEDITEKKRTEQRIQELSYYDQLTGLPNLKGLHNHFTHTIEQSPNLAVLWIDLDNFKDINDSLGHGTGDLLLVKISHRLRNVLDAKDILSRQSGDDFIAILALDTQENVTQQVQKFQTIASKPMQLANQEISITASIGIALYPNDAQDLDTLLKHAEAAMYRCKEDGRNTYCYFMPEMQERAARTLGLSNALKQAQQREEMYLVYQPQVDTNSGCIVGAEVLLRWNSPHWGMVSPAEFIPIAESSGLIIPIGTWVLHTALNQLRKWLDKGFPPITLAVNLSAAQFNQTHLPQLISQLLDQAGVPAHCLELELTEATAMKSPETAVQIIDELRQQGIRIAIDDFGTGYSSLSYLKRFEAYKIKIDQSFVRDIQTDPNDQAITIAIINMARSLGMKTVAEAVETAEQLEFLQAHGCDGIQGYYYSRPLPAKEFEQYLNDNAHLLSARPAP